jgi:hypothetical protein
MTVVAGAGMTLEESALLDAVPDAIIVVDDLGVIRQLNHAAVELFGYQRQDLMGKPVEILVPDRLRAVHVRYRSDYVARPHVRPMGMGVELLARRSDGSHLAVEISLNPVRFAGAGFVVASVRDCTERQRLRARAWEARSSENLGRLARGIVHDFANLLTVIAGNAGALEAGNLPADAARDAVRSIIDATESGARLTRDIRTLVAGQELQLEVVDVPRVVEASLGLLRAVVGPAVSVEATLPTEPLGVAATTARLEQVLLNVTLNARDAMPDGGVLRVCVAARDAADAGEGAASSARRQVRLVVADTGCGMDAATCGRAFEPFFSTKQAGRGMGLAIVRGVVQQLGGTIGVTSAPGRGTEVEILLPLAEEEARIVRGEDLPAEARSKATVLVVEPDLATQRLLAQALTHAGHVVHAAGNVADARKHARHASPPVGLLVCSLALPGGEGQALADELRIGRPELRALLIDGGASTTTSNVGHRAGQALLVKPFTPSELLAAVGGLLGEPRAAHVGRTVLVVDDDSSLREWMCSVLQADGMRVRVAGDGQQALDLVQREQVDLVVTDLAMPGMDGLELLTALRRDRPGQGVLATSGAVASHATLQVARCLGAAGTLAKPFTGAALIAAVRAALAWAPGAGAPP